MYNNSNRGNIQSVNKMRAKICTMGSYKRIGKKDTNLSTEESSGN